MRLNLQFPANLVTFTEEILHGKLHFLCSVMRKTTSAFGIGKSTVSANVRRVKKAIFQNTYICLPQKERLQKWQRNFTKGAGFHNV